jgi:hypothetical protein
MTPTHSAKSPNQPPIAKGFLNRGGVYILGFLIVYFGMSWSVGITYSSIPDVRKTAAIVMGAFVALPVAVMHLGVQIIARRLLRRIRSLRPLPELLVLNVPGILFIGYLLTTSYWSMSAPAVFERFVLNPMPSSVRILQHGGGKINFAEGDRRVIQFEINDDDRATLIRQGKFSSTNSDRTGAEWNRLIWGYTQLDLDFQTPDTIYNRKLPPYQKEDVEEFLFCWTNSSTVVFFRLDR